MNDTATIIVAVLASNGLFALIQFLVTRYDTKNNIKETLKKLEKDGLRTQLLLMVLLRPEERQEIMTLGEKYFHVLKGNWYMTSIFNKWLTEYCDGVQPEWFNN